MQNNSDYYSGEYGIRYWTVSFSVFSSLKSSVNCLITKDKIFAPMDDDRPCSIHILLRFLKEEEGWRETET